MSLAGENKTDDNFESYYLEKIWEMIPAYYRHEDGVADSPDVLRSIVTLVAQEVANVRRSHDQLWQDQSIEHSQDWAVPYIGDLLATRLLSAFNSRGRRIDVAKTIYYRRRKGTLGVLEELISDIAGWEGRVVESFQRLARIHHGLDPALPSDSSGSEHGYDANKLIGSITATPQGGTADLRVTQGQDLVGGAFDEYFYTPDFRQHKGQLGRYNIPKLAFHIFRLKAYPVLDSTPFRLDNRRYAFDPSGRETPLFSARQRAADWHDWQPAQLWELPAPISCRLLNQAKFVISNRLLSELENDLGVSPAAATALGMLSAQIHPSEAKLMEMIGSLNQPELETPAASQLILKSALVENCGKQQLIPNSIAVYQNNSLIEPEITAAANLENWPVADPEKRILIDPKRGVMQFFGSVPRRLNCDYHYGIPLGIGAGTHDRSHVETIEPTTVIVNGAPVNAASLHVDGVTQINDSKTHSFAGNKNQITNMSVISANAQRPYLVLSRNWVLRPSNDGDASLYLDGLWFGCRGAARSIILRGVGDFEEVVIDHCSLDPGGSRAISGNVIQPVSLIIECKVEKLIIRHSVIGRIDVRGTGLVEEIDVSDSIIDVAGHAALSGSPQPYAEQAINASSADLNLNRSTVLGVINVNRLWASNSMLLGLPLISDTQTGCFRFSAAPPDARLPKPYESHSIIDRNTLFISTLFGHPNYAQLSETSSSTLRLGGDNGADIGAFNELITPIKQNSLATKLDEYMPFGLVPLFIYET